MIKNYLLLSLKVLRRKPFYTFVSLFGISFTLMILMLITSMADGALGDNAPLSNRDRLVFAPFMERLKYEKDTTPIIDSIRMDDGTWRVDTAYSSTEEVSSNSTNAMDFRFLDQHLRDLEKVENYSFLSPAGFTDGYVDGRKYTFSTFYTDGAYWEIFDFNFIEGGPFTATDVEQANRVVIMTQKAVEGYFGQNAGEVVGREVVLGPQTFTVHGVVDRPLTDLDLLTADVWVPYTTSEDPKLLNTGSMAGPFTPVFLARTPEDRASITEQINYFTEQFQMPAEEEWFEEIKIPSYTFTEVFAGRIVREKDGPKAVRTFFIPVLLLLSLFVLLPLINLINLNVSRVFERQSEIGVRKAFGAQPRDILTQFVFENLVLTFLGGAVGLLLAVAIIRTVNARELLGQIRLALSPSVFFYFIIVILLFGLLSGLLPAYRMSKTNVAEALR